MTDYNRQCAGLLDVCEAPKYSRLEVFLFAVQRHERGIFLGVLVLLTWWAL